MKLALLLTCLAAHVTMALEIVAGKKVFHDCANLRAAGDELLFTHSDGTARVRCEDLSASLRQKYFKEEEAQKAIAARAAQTRAQKDMVAEAARQKELSAKQESARAAVAAEMDWQRRKREHEKEQEGIPTGKDADFMRSTQARYDKLSGQLTAARMKNLDDYAAGKLDRFTVKIIGPTKTGQLVRIPSGITAHITGDLGLADGEEQTVCCEEAGRYEYTNAVGGAARVRNYIGRGPGGDDVAMEVYAILIAEIKMRAAKKAGVNVEERWRALSARVDRLIAGGSRIKPLAKF